MGLIYGQGPGNELLPVSVDGTGQLATVIPSPLPVSVSNIQPNTDGQLYLFTGPVHNNIVQAAAAATHTLTSAAVGANLAWEIESIHVLVVTGTCSNVSVYIEDPGATVQVIFFAMPTPTIARYYPWTGMQTVSAGYRIKATFSGLTIGANVHFGYHGKGYRID